MKEAADASAKKTGYDVTIMQYDITEYPTIRLYLDVRDAGDGAVKELAHNMFYISERDAGTGDFLNRSIQKAVLLNKYAEDPSGGMGRDKEIAVYVQKQGQGGEAVMGLDLGSEYFESLLGSYLRSYINDMNNHQYQELARYVDDTVAEDDKYSIQWQMRKQVSGGFSNVTAETLMSYQITDFIVEDSSTIRLLTDESYDVIYDEVYGELKNSTRTVAQDAVACLQNDYGYTPDDSAKVRIWAMVNQKPEYILKQSPDGRWKFSRYAGAFMGSSEFYVYDVELTDW